MILACRSNGKYSRELNDDTGDEENLPPLQPNYFQEKKHRHRANQKSSEKKRWMTKSMRLLVNSGSHSSGMDLSGYKYNNLQDDVPIDKSMPSPTPTQLLDCSPRSDDSSNSIVNFDDDDCDNSGDDGHPLASSFNKKRTSAVKLDFEAVSTSQDKSCSKNGDDFDDFVVTKFHPANSTYSNIPPPPPPPRAPKNSHGEQGNKGQKISDKDKQIASAVTRDLKSTTRRISREDNQGPKSGSIAALETTLYSKRLSTNLTKQGDGDIKVVNDDDTNVDNDNGDIGKDRRSDAHIEKVLHGEGDKEDDHDNTKTGTSRASFSETPDANFAAGQGNDQSSHVSINMAGIVEQSPSMLQDPPKERSQDKEDEENHVNKGKTVDELSKVLDDNDIDPAFVDEENSAQDEVETAKPSIPEPVGATDTVVVGIVDDGVEMVSANPGIVYKGEETEPSSAPQLSSSMETEKHANHLFDESDSGNANRITVTEMTAEETKLPGAEEQKHQFLPTLQSSLSFDLHVPPALKSVLSDLVSVTQNQSDEQKSGTDQGATLPKSTDFEAPSLKAVLSELVNVTNQQTEKGTKRATAAPQAETHKSNSKGQGHDRSTKDAKIRVDTKDASPVISETAQSLYQTSKINSKRLVENHLRWVEKKMTTTTTTTSNSTNKPEISVSSLKESGVDTHHNIASTPRSERKKKKRFAKSLKNVLLFHRQQRGKVERKETTNKVVRQDGQTKHPSVSPGVRTTKAPLASTIWHRPVAKAKKIDSKTEVKPEESVKVDRSNDLEPIRKETGNANGDSKQSLEDDKPPKVVRNYKKVFPWLSNNGKKGEKAIKSKTTKEENDVRFKDVNDCSDGSTNESYSTDDNDDNDGARDVSKDDDDEDEQPGIVASPSWLENAAAVAMETVIALDPSLDFEDEYDDCPSFEYEDEDDLLSVFLNPLDPPRERPDADESVSITNYIWSKLKCSHPCDVQNERTPESAKSLDKIFFGSS